MITTSMSKIETKCLDEGHVGKRDTDTRSTLGAKPANENGIDDIIEGGGDHRNDGRHRHLTNQTLHRFGRHLFIFIFKCHLRIISVFPLELSNCNLTVFVFPLRT